MYEAAADCSCEGVSTYLYARLPSDFADLSIIKIMAVCKKKKKKKARQELGMHCL